ncbi:MAG: hypothetical protein FWF98_04765, partial [Dehalococcoidia bacterium]|nr:hypothetical protein [Dehalococcoidia bacterium]
FRGIMALKCGWNEFLDNSATAVWLLTALICGYLNSFKSTPNCKFNFVKMSYNGKKVKTG